MGSVIFDFLNDSFLFDEAYLSDSFSSLTESALQKEINDYREFSVSKIPELQEEINLSSGKVKVFGAEDYFDIPHLMQTAFYIDQVILPDPIFPFSAKTSALSQTMSQYLGMVKNHSIDRKRLAKSIAVMKSVTPMIASNYVKFFPVSYYFEPGESVPMTFSDNYFSDVLPPDTLSVYHDRANVNSLIKRDNDWLVERELKIGRGIAIDFSGDSESNIYVYHLFEQEIKKIGEEKNVAYLQITLPDEEPAIDYFNAWVFQSVNKSAQAHYQTLFREIFLSSRFGASYLTSSPFSFEILRSPVIKNVSDHTLECVINMDLPFLSGISMTDLMSIRDNEGDAFDAFRRALESQLRDLRGEDDPAKLKIKYQNALHELAEVQVTKIERTVRGLRKGALAQTGLAIGGLAASVVTSGWSVAATLLALAQGFRTYSEYKEKIKDNPSYFLWKVKNA